MRLADAIQNWLKEQEWEDEQERNEEEETSIVATGYTIDGQNYKLILESDDKRDWLKVYLYAPFKAKKSKRKEMYELLNHINLNKGVGKICLLGDGEICVHHVVDVEDTNPSMQMISNMLWCVCGFYQSWFEEISAVALTKTTAQDVFDELDKPDEVEEVPDFL